MDKTVKVVITILIIHIVLCLLVYLLMRISVLKSPRQIMPVVSLVPLWGVLSLIFLEIRIRGKQEIHEEAGIEKLKINDAIHRSILMEEDPIEESVVPLEEALLINDSVTRRELMMEVMYSDPGNYVWQLKEARTNDDTEVVHYAVTALAELQKDYEIKFQELEWELEKDPDNDEITDRYLKLLNQYLDSGIAAGSDRTLKLRSYSNMLERKLKNNPDRIYLWKEKASTDLRIGEYEDARQEIEFILDEWNHNEAGYLLMLRYCSAMKDRKGIETVLNAIEKRNIYLTPEGRSQVKFWKEEGRDRA